MSGDPLLRSAYPYRRLAVIGAGAYGTALAHVAAQDGTQVSLWSRRAEIAETINRTARNPRYLGEIDLAPSITASDDLMTALRDADAVLLVVPSHAIRSAARAMRPVIPAGIPIVVCAKGIEAETGLLMSQIVEDELPGHSVGALSGPTFATELAAGHPSAATLAFSFDQADRLDPENSAAARMAVTLATPAFRTYLSDDLVGVEIGGAVKNVLAIACGVVEGLGLGQNARAALIARGYAEMLRFGEALGARAETLAGLCGLGDLVLTCSSTASRNFSLGKALGEGGDPQALMADRRTVAEGAHTAPVLGDLASRHAVEMPIVDAVCALLDGAPASDVVTALLTRPLRAEGRAGA